MADSDITITALAAAGVVGGVLLVATYAAPAGQGCLPYMQPDKFEYWESTTNNRNSATKVGESVLPTFTRTGLVGAVTRYYWARAVDSGGRAGDYFPLSATGGIVGTSTLAPIQPALDAITTDYTTKIATETSQRTTAVSALASRTSTVEAALVNPTSGLTALLSRITTEETARLTADTSFASQLTSVLAKADAASAEGRLEFDVQAGEFGYSATIALLAKAGLSGALREAGMYIDVNSSIARIRFRADRFALETTTGAEIAVFTADGKLRVGRLEAGIIDAQAYFKNGEPVVATGSVVANAISNMVVTGRGSPRSPGQTLQTATIGLVTGALRIDLSATQDLPAANGAAVGVYRVVLYRNGSEVTRRAYNYDDDFCFPVSFFHSDDPGPGTWTYTADFAVESGAGGFLVRDCVIAVTNFKR